MADQNFVCACIDPHQKLARIHHMNTETKFPKIQELLAKKWIWIEDAEKPEDGKVYCGSDDEWSYLLGVVGQEEALEAFLQKWPTPWYWGPVPSEYPYTGKLNSQSK